MAQKRRVFTEEEVLKAHAEAGSLGDFIALLGFKRNGGNHQTGKKILKEFGLEAPVYDRTEQLQSLHKKKFIPNEEWFVDGIKRSNDNSKKRMFKLGIENKCECGQGPEWNGKPLVLELDHIDGNMFNNTLENLRILCGHCHSQTKNFCTVNKKPNYNYCDCGRRISNQAVNCKVCASKARGVKTRKYDWPETNIICQMVKEKGFVYAGKQIGCSDNAVRKHLKAEGVDLKTL